MKNTQVEIMEPILSDVVVDTKHYPLQLPGERAVIFREAVLRGWFVGVRRRFGTGGEAFLYYEGFESGQEIMETYLKIGVKREHLWSMFAAAFIAIGGARRVECEVVNDRIVLRVWDNIECSLAKGHGKAFSQFF